MKARIITTEELTITNNELPDRILYLVLDKENVSNSYIAFKESGVVIKVSVDNLSQNRAITCSELVERLKNKNWLLPKLIYVVEKEGGDFDIVAKELNISFYSPTPILKYEDEKSISTPETITNQEFDEAWDNIFGAIEDLNRDMVRNTIENMANTGEIYLYSSSKELVDLLAGSRTVNLVDPKSDIYTNSIDTKVIIEGKIINSTSTINSKIDLSIQYTMGNKNIIYTHDVIFSGFSVEGGVLKLPNIINRVGDDIVIEYIDGIIRVIPVSQNVNECIINSCSITYGNLR